MAIELKAEIRGAEVGRMLAELAARGMDTSEPFGEIGVGLVLSTRERSRSERGPNGETWAALSPRYQRRRVGRVGRRRGSKHMLRQRRTLYNSIAHVVDDQSVAVGSGVEYAAIHQLGGTADMAPGPAAIPARPFLGISAQDEGDVVDVLGSYLSEAFR